MDEDTSVNQNSPIKNDNQDEVMSTGEINENEIKEHANQFDSNDKSLMEVNNELISNDENVEDLKNNPLDKDNQLDKDNKARELANLNDDISDDENFKDEELDFEEVDNSRGNLNEDKKKIKAAEEDGEVNSEEELEDGEVKEEDSDEELGEQQDADSNANKPTPANLNSLCRFYSKGLCTWGSNCRFIHQKPIGQYKIFFSRKSREILHSLLNLFLIFSQVPARLTVQNLIKLINRNRI